MRDLLRKSHHGKRLTAGLLSACILALSVCGLMTDSRAASSRSEVITTIEGIHANFPESYWEGLDALLTKHPNWKFVAFQTGLTWERCFQADSELYLCRNLVMTNTDGSLVYPSSWYSTDIPGAYNWAANSWTRFDSGRWYQASEEAIAYCMDPRNFFSEDQVFMFMDGGSPIEEREQALATVAMILWRVGIYYWMRPAEECNIYKYIEVDNPDYIAYRESLIESIDASIEESIRESVEASIAEQETADQSETVPESGDQIPEIDESGSESSDPSESSESVDPTEERVYEDGPDAPPKTIEQIYYMRYPDAIEEAAYYNGVNQLMIATRIMQEHGAATSPLISGTQGFTLKDGTYISGGYYNYYNQGASGNSQAEIIQNGLREAYAEVWDTRYKALYGGAEKYMRSYIERGQTTLYSQKFSVDSSSKRLFFGQYMQNLTAPQSETRILYNAIKECNAVDLDYTFIIPIFSNMPSSPAPYPEKDGNPNYKVGSIYVNGEAIDPFSEDCMEYGTVHSGTTEDEYSVTVQTLAYAPETSVKVSVGEGEDEAVFDADKTISEGRSYHTAEFKLGEGDHLIRVTSTAENGDSRTYAFTVHVDIVIPPPPETEPETESETEPESVSESESESESESVPVESSSGTEDPSGSASSEEEIRYGDVDDDREITIFDIVMIRSSMLGFRSLSEREFETADVDFDREITIFDIVKIRSYMLGYIERLSR